MVFFLLYLSHTERMVKEARYGVRDYDRGLKGYMPYLLNETNEYFKTSPDFPDILDSATEFEHLGLEQNKWSKVKPNFSPGVVRKIELYPMFSTIVVELENPLEYEVTGEFAYNYILYPIVGTYELNGTASQINITLKVIPPSLKEGLRIRMESMEARFEFTSIRLDSDDSDTKHYKIKEFAEKIFKDNMNVLSESFIKALDNAAPKFFSKIYPKEDNWKFSTLNHTFEHSMKNIVVEGELNEAKELVMNYNIIYGQKKVYKIRADCARRIILGMDVIKEVMLEIFKHSIPPIEDKDLPGEMDDRLDIITFQKYIPDAALVSIKKHKLENNNISLTFIPINTLTYSLANTPETLLVTAEYNYSFENYGMELVKGNVVVSFGIGIEWVKEGLKGLLNFGVKEVSVLKLNVKENVYPVFEEGFREFFTELSGPIISKLKNFKLIDKGIPIQGTLAEYKETKRYWNEKLDEIIIEFL